MKQDVTVESTDLALNNSGDNDTLGESSRVVSTNVDEHSVNENSVTMDEQPKVSQPSVEVEDVTTTSDLQQNDTNSIAEGQNATVSTGNSFTFNFPFECSQIVPIHMNG